jgi:hypothetical protein
MAANILFQLFDQLILLGNHGLDDIANGQQHRRRCCAARSYRDFASAWKLYEIAIGILDDELALADFYIISPIPSVFAFSIEWLLTDIFAVGPMGTNIIGAVALSPGIWHSAVLSHYRARGSFFGGSEDPGNRFFISPLLQAVPDEPDITWLTAPECPIHHPMP